MRIQLNGQVRDIQAGMTVASLLTELEIRGRVAVEHNRHILLAADHPATSLADGDQLEVVTFVGGG